MLQNWLLLDLRAKIDFLVLFGLLGSTEHKQVWCHFFLCLYDRHIGSQNGRHPNS